MARVSSLLLSLLMLAGSLSLMVGEMEANSQTLPDSSRYTSPSPSDAWASAAGGTGADMAWDMVMDSSGNTYVTGTFTGTATFGSTTLSSNGGTQGFVGKVDNLGNWQWAAQTQGQYDAIATSITLGAGNDLYVGGFFTDSTGQNDAVVQIGGTTLMASAGSTTDAFVAKIDTTGGQWMWAKTSEKFFDTWTQIEEFGTASVMDLIFHQSKVFVVGSFTGTLASDSTSTYSFASNGTSTDIFVGALTSGGAWDFQAGLGSAMSSEMGTAIHPTINGGFIFAGNFQGSSSYWSYPLTSAADSQDVFIGHVDSTLNVTWVTGAGGTGVDNLYDLETDSSGNVYAVGNFEGALASFGSTQLSASTGSADVWVAKVDTSGNWLWARKAGGAGEDLGMGIALSPDEKTLYTTGEVAGQVSFENSHNTLIETTNGSSDAFVALSDAATGDWQELFLAGGPMGGDRGWAMEVDSSNVTHVVGRFKGTSTTPGEFGSDDLVSSGDFDVFAWKGLIEDADGDRYADEEDYCPDVWGNATVAPYLGCPDQDGDGYADMDDTHPFEPTQWRDADGDTFGDNPNGHLADDCPSVNGTSTVDRNGCTDSDSDGWSDQRDAFPTLPSQWNDTDGDEFGDNWNDPSFDDRFLALGYGQYYPGAQLMDHCPTLIGVDNFDAPGCPDTDLDGHSDLVDDFINNPTQWKDSDGDGWGDNDSTFATQRDEVPYDETQYQDRDGDGWGDDPDGNNADRFPDDWTQQVDFDNDGYGDNTSGTNGDACPEEWGDSWRDRLGCPDVDGDGTSDLFDAFSSDWSQWNDTDGDGFGDNWANPHWNDSRRPHWPGEYIPGANNADKFPLDRDGDSFEDEELGGTIEPYDTCPDEPGSSTEDRFGCTDTDGDGWSDVNDAFDFEVTQWLDSDRDGFGDSLVGIDGDACPTVRGDSQHDRIGCPDTDGDGWSDMMDDLAPNPWNYSDGADLFPADPEKWNESHVIKMDSGKQVDGGLAAGIGLGALITVMFAMVFVFLILKFRENESDEDEYEYEYEDEEEEEYTSRAAELARSWQDHGTAPPPPPEGAEMVTSAPVVTQAAAPAGYVAPPPPTAENTIAAPAAQTTPVVEESEPVMDDMDTSLAMSLLVDGSKEDEAEVEESEPGEAAEVELGEDEVDWDA